MASKHPAGNLDFCRIALRPWREEIATCKPLAQNGLPQKLESEGPLATSESFTKRTGGFGDRMLGSGTAIRTVLASG